MKKIIFLITISILSVSCNSNTSDTIIASDTIIGNWNLFSQEINGTEVATICTKKTLFSFENNTILTQTFYTETNTICDVSSTVVSSWNNIGNSRYRIQRSDGFIRTIEVVFFENDEKFSISETNSNGDVTFSVFKKG